MPLPLPFPARPSLRPLAAWLLALLAFALAPWTAGAEPMLVGSLPAEDATVAAAPAEIELFFLEPVPAVVASLIDRHGATTPLAATVDPADPRHVVAPLPADIGDGVWTIGWSAPDAEGRPTAGTFAFRVANDRVPGAAATAGEWPRPWALAARWLVVLGAALAAGVAVLGMVGRRGPGAIPTGAAGIAALGATLALVATVAEPILAAILSTGDAPVPLADAFAAMPPGWWLRLVALALLALLTLGLLATRRAAAPPLWASAAALGLAGAALVGLGLSGHAATAYGAPRPLGAIAEIVHAVSLALFAGSLAAALFGRVPRPTGGDWPDERQPSPIARFARLALPLGVIALVTGAIAAALVLPRLQGLWAGAYGWLLLLDGVLLIAALALSARAALAAARRPDHVTPGAPVALKLAAPLALLAMLGASTLPLLAAPGTATMPTLARLDLAAAVPLGHDRSGEIHLSLAPAVPGENGVVFELETADGAVLAPAEAPVVELTLHPLDHPGEARTVALVPDRFGGWATGEVDLPGAGWWQADVTLVPPGGRGSRVPFWFVLPDPNVTGHGPTPAADPAAQAVFERAMAALSDLRSVRYTQRLSDGSGSLYQSALEVTDAVDGRPVAFAERSPRFESVVVGDTQWVREVSEPSWRERAAPSLSLPSAWSETYTAAEGFRLGPTVEIDGEQSQVVTFYLPRTPRSAAAWFAWWVGEETGRIRRETMVSSRHYMVYTFADFNADIRIEPPAPRQGPPATPVP